MNDPLKRLEAEMAGMRPTPISAELTGRIEMDIAANQGRVSPWPDRFLLSAIGSGALAACVIVGVLVNAGPASSPSTPPIAAIRPTPRAAEFVATPMAFVRADPMWAEFLK